MLELLSVEFEFHIWLLVKTVTHVHEKLEEIFPGFQNTAKSSWTGTSDKLRRKSKSQETIISCINFLNTHVLVFRSKQLLQLLRYNSENETRDAY